MLTGGANTARPAGAAAARECCSNRLLPMLRCSRNTYLLLYCLSDAASCTAIAVQRVKPCGQPKRGRGRTARTAPQRCEWAAYGSATPSRSTCLTAPPVPRHLPVALAPPPPAVPGTTAGWYDSTPTFHKHHFCQGVLPVHDHSAHVSIGYAVLRNRCSCEMRLVSCLRIPVHHSYIYGSELCSLQPEAAGLCGDLIRPLGGATGNNRRLWVHLQNSWMDLSPLSELNGTIISKPSIFRPEASIRSS